MTSEGLHRWAERGGGVQSRGGAVLEPFTSHGILSNDTSSFKHFSLHLTPFATKQLVCEALGWERGPVQRLW